MANIKNLKQTQKDDSRERILTVSARLFRTQGFSATGIDQIMSQASLTAGAFYAHFRSKEELFEKTLERELENSKSLLIKDTEGLHGESKTKAILKRYCSSLHRDFPEKGCVLPALAAEIYRGTSRSTQIVSEYIEKWIDLIIDNLAQDVPEEIKREQAVQIVSRSVGAILLSRIVREGPLSEEILLASQKI